MMCLALALLTSCAGDEWRSTFFENVYLHSGSQPVTVQVAWLEPETVSTDTLMVTVVSVFSYNPRVKRLLSSKQVGRIFSPRIFQAIELHKDKVSGEAFLVLPLMDSDRVATGVFLFDQWRPERVLLGNYDAKQLNQGKVLEFSQAKVAGVKRPMWDHPNPPVERILTYDRKSRSFRKGPWKVKTFGPAVGEIRGVNRGHSYRVRLQIRNFRLGRRKVGLTTDGQITLAGRPVFGMDKWTHEELPKLRERSRELFMTELVTFRVWVDGVELKVPGRLWRDCMEVHLEPNEYLFAWLSSDGKRLVVKALCSDASGGYIVIWTLRSNGAHQRKFDYPD